MQQYTPPDEIAAGTRNQAKQHALSIIVGPKPHHSQVLRILAWAILKSERGQTIRQHRLTQRVAR